MIAVKTPTSLASIARSRATAGIMTLSASTLNETITWMASMLATGMTVVILSEAKDLMPLPRSTARWESHRFPSQWGPSLRSGRQKSHPEQVGLVQDGVAQDA